MTRVRILDLDLDYPQEMHDFSKDYPKAAEIMTITQDKLSLSNRVHRVTSFTQTAFLRPFIEFTTGECKRAKTEFEKDIFI